MIVIKPYGAYPARFHTALAVAEEGFILGLESFSHLMFCDKNWRTDVRYFRACREAWKSSSSLARDVENTYFLQCKPLVEGFYYKITWKKRPPPLPSIDSLLVLGEN